eukprot:588014_1
MDTQFKQSVFMWYIEHEARNAGIHLPSSAIHLCIKMIGINSFVWRIDDLTLIKKILSAQSKYQFDSDAFRISELDWKIRLYSNGMDEEDGGYCGVCVRLLEMPSSWKSVFCQFHIECPQMQKQMQKQMLFSQSYNTSKGYAFYFSSLEDLKAACDKKIVFVITISITRITLKEKNK